MKKILAISILLIITSINLTASIIDTSSFQFLNEEIIDYKKIAKNYGNTDERGHSIVRIEFYLDKKSKHYWLVSYYDDGRILMRDISKDFKNEK